MANKDKQNGTAKAIAEMGELPDYKTSRVLAASNLRQLVKDQQKYRAERDAAEALVKDCNEQIAELLEKAKVDSVAVDSHRVTRVESAGRSTLDKNRLMELGVAADTIIKATVQGKPFVTIKITEIGK